MSTSHSCLITLTVITTGVLIEYVINMTVQYQSLCVTLLTGKSVLAFDV